VANFKKKSYLKKIIVLHIWNYIRLSLFWLF
jgi:hypothetical protein